MISKKMMMENQGFYGTEKDDELDEDDSQNEENADLSDTISEDDNDENEQNDAEDEEDKDPDMEDNDNIEAQDDDGDTEEEESSGCFSGFKSIPGDIPGDGLIKGGMQTDEEGCARLCKSDIKCCSYKHSLSKSICYLNEECSPSERKKQDFNFCVKSDRS